MFNIEHFKDLKSEEFYETLLFFSKGLVDGERNQTANLANIASLIYNTMENINWAGFYLMNQGELVLGPFHGKPACIRIQVGKGVCGTAISSGESQLVSDVQKFSGHIPCDGDTKSEVVIPINGKNGLIGVLDIDSPVLNRFDTKDLVGLEQLVDLIEQACDWEV